MNAYSIINTQSGEVVSTLRCEDTQLPPLADNQILVAGEYTNRTHYYDGANVVPYTTEQAAIKSTIPLSRSYWSNATFSYHDAQSLEEAKVFKWQQIKAKRAELEYGSFTWDGSTFDSDLESQQKIMGAVSMANMYANYMVDWTLADNSVRTLTASEVKAVGVALAQFVNSIYSTARLKRTEIDAATTVQAVLDITW